MTCQEKYSPSINMIVLLFIAAFCDSVVKVAECLRTAQGVLKETAQAEAKTCACSEGVKLVVCTQVKNEVAYLPEWIAYHHALGIQKFVIYDDGSTDGVGSFAKLYSARNMTVDIEVLPALTDVRDPFMGQTLSFTDCLKRNKDATWVGVLDVDEFFVPKFTTTEPCRAKDSLKCLLNGVEEDHVHFSEVRFSSTGRLRNFDIRFNGKHTRKPLTSTTMPSVDKQLVEQDLSCSGLSEDSVTVTDPPCLTMGVVNPLGHIPTLTQSNVWRQPLPGTTDDYEARARVVACHDPRVEAAAKWNVCTPGPGKSFVRPGRCNTYWVHACHEPATLSSKQIRFEEGQLNHYYLRSAEAACKKMIQWKKPDPVVYYQTVDKSYMHFVEDRSASKLVPGMLLQQEIAKLFRGLV